MTPKENVSEKSAANRRYNILVVDDNEAAAMGLSKLLSHLGHTTSVAHSGAQALDIFEVFKPDVVLLDIGLPDMTGYKVAERLRAVNQGRPLPTLIALTGYGQEEDKALARTAGFDHHLTKPVSIAEVQHVLLSARS